MNRDDIIRMAREAGHKTRLDSANASYLVRFANLVAAAEREACAVIAETPIAELGTATLFIFTHTVT